MHQTTAHLQLYHTHSVISVLRHSFIYDHKMNAFSFNGNSKTSNNIGTEYTYEDILKIKEFLVKKIDIVPKVGIICGSGLGSMGEAVRDAVIIDYKDIPSFPISTVPGHKGRLIFGTVCDVPVMCMQGRFHYYEGYPLSKCVMPVRLMKLMGATHLIASNAAGGLNPQYKVGDIMLQRDHLNLMGFAGNNPLIGPNDLRFGPRFFAMTNAYDPFILNGVKELVKELGIEDKVQEGVYTCMGGPNYETVAELRALRVLGIDAVGMSTVHEVTAARHCGMKCFAFSLITNICCVEYDSLIEATCEEVLDVGRQKESELRVFVENVVKFIGKHC